MHEKAEAARLCFLVVNMGGKCKLASVLPAVQETAYLGLILKHGVIEDIALDMKLEYFILHGAVCSVQLTRVREFGDLPDSPVKLVQQRLRLGRFERHGDIVYRFGYLCKMIPQIRNRTDRGH